MSYDGSGTYTLPSPQYPAVPGGLIKAADYNAILADLQTALSLCMVRDGQSLATGNFNMNSHKLVGLAAGTVAGDAVRFEQVMTAAAVALGVLTPAADKFPYFDSSSTATMLTIVSAIRTVLASADVATMRTNMGLKGAAILDVGTTAGTVAAGNDSRFGNAGDMFKADNLSGLANYATARSHMGLGGAAVLAVGSTTGTVCAGDDSRLSDQRTPVDKSATYAKIQDISATARVLGRKTAAAGVTEEVSLSELLDFIGSAAAGDILYRGASAWARLGKGADTNVLTLASGLPSWASPAGGGSPSGYIAGLGLSISAGDTDHDITIAAGTARDSTNTYDLVLASAMTKRIDASWAAGNNNGGMASGSVGNSTYYYYWLIRKDSDGSIDVMIDPAADGSHIPAGYTAKRVIGRIRSNGSANINLNMIVSANADVGGREIWTTTESGGSFVQPPWTPEYDVEVQAGGGDGGACATYGGSGGSGGGYARKRIKGQAAATSTTVTVGGGGATSSFGALVSCTGGGAGAANTGTPSAAGAGTGGDINISGQLGGMSHVMWDATNVSGGRGGSSCLGQGGSNTAGAGLNGTGYGSGGSGGGGAPGGGTSGGYGASGVIMITM